MSALNNDYLPSLNNDSTVIETADHYYMFDDSLDPAILQEFRKCNQTSGWQQVRDNQLRLMRRNALLESQVAEKDQKIERLLERCSESNDSCHKLLQEKQGMQLGVAKLKDEVRKLRGILKDEGIELVEDLQDAVEMDSASKGKGRVVDESERV